MKYALEHQDQLIANFWSIAMLVFLFGGIVWVLYVLHANDGNDFDLASMFTDKSGRADKYAVGYFIALFTGVWLIVTMELSNHTNEFVVATFFGLAIGAYSAKRYFDAKEAKEATK